MVGPNEKHRQEARLGLQVTFTKKGWHGLTRLNREEMFCRFGPSGLDIAVRRPWKRRHIDVAGLIAEAAGRLGPSQIPPFYVNISDRPFFRRRRSRTRFSACQSAGSADVAAPDFTFAAWPEAQYDDFDAKCAAIAASGAKPPLDDRAVWLGRTLTAARKAVVALGDRHPDRIFARDLTSDYDHPTHLYKGAFLGMEEQAARYRYFIDIEGNGYSARLKLLLHSGRVVLLQDAPWREYFLADLEPFRHFVPVRRDLSDLMDKLEWLRAHPDREKGIASEAKMYAGRHLTRRAAVSAWARCLAAHVEANGRLTSGLQSLPRPIG